MGTWYGPVHKPFAALPDDKADELKRIWENC